MRYPLLILLFCACVKQAPVPSILGAWQLTFMEHWHGNLLQAAAPVIDTWYTFSETDLTITQDGQPETLPYTRHQNQVVLSTGFSFVIQQLTHTCLVLSKHVDQLEMKYYFLKL